MENDFNFNVSWSALNLFLYCERDFYYSYVVKENPTDFPPIKYGEYGKCVHSCIEKCFFSEEEIKGEYNSFGLYEYGYTLQEIYANVKYAENFIKANLSKKIKKELEYNFLYYDEATNVRCNIKGFVDCYDEDKKIIVDWKTSTYQNNKVGDYRKQINFYALIHYMKTGEIIKTGYVVFTKAQKIFKEEFKIKNLENMKKKVFDILKKIKNKKNKYDYIANPKIGFFSQYKKLLYEDSYTKNKIDIIYDDENLIISQKPFDEIISKVMNKEFSYLVDGAEFSKRVMALRGIKYDGFKRFYNYKNKSLPVGFLNRVKVLMKKYVEYKKNGCVISYKKISQDKKFEKIDIKKNNNFTLRDYQEKVIGEVLKK